MKLFCYKFHRCRFVCYFSLPDNKADTVVIVLRKVKKNLSFMLSVRHVVFFGGKCVVNRMERLIISNVEFSVTEIIDFIFNKQSVLN